ncbi:MAG: DVUA0089 family protein [Cyanobacteria bacterium P01_E01_bin.35]
MSPELNNLISQAIESGIGVTQAERITLSNSIDQLSDIDLYSLQLTQGQGITLDIDTVDQANNTVNFDSFLRIFDASGQELAFNDDFTESGAEFSLDSYLGFIANSTGTYYVGVSSVANQQYNLLNGDHLNQFSHSFIPGSYDLSFNLVEVEADRDPDSTIIEAIDTDIDSTDNFNAVISDKIQTNSDVDIYRVQLEAGTGIRVNLNAQGEDSPLDSYLRLFDADGNELAFNDNSLEDLKQITNNSAIAFAPEVSGEYFVGVSSAGNFDYDQVNGDTNLNFSPNTGTSQGDYELQLEVVAVVADSDPDNTIAEALDSNLTTSGSSPDVINDAINTELDVDLFQFELGAAEGVFLQIDTSELDSELDSLLRVFDAEGNELALDDNDDANFTGDFSQDASLAFLPENPGKYFVGVGTSGNFAYDPIRGRTNFSKEVISPFSTTGSYQLGIDIVEVTADQDPDNTIAEAVDSSVSSQETRNLIIDGEIDLTTDVDVHRFQLEQGDGITLKIDTPAGNSNLDSFLRLFDAAGNELGFDDDDDENNLKAESGTDSILNFVADTSGAYFIGVSSDGNSNYDVVAGSNNFTPNTGSTKGKYSLALDISTVVAVLDPDDTIAEAMDVLSGAKVQSPQVIADTIDSVSDVDIYQIQLNQDSRVRLDLDAAELGTGLDSFLQVLDAEGNQLAFNDDDSAPNENSSLDSYLEFTAPETGKYFIGVSSSGNFNYDPLNGSNNFSSNAASTIGDYELAIAY